MNKTKISSRGQTVIPREIRKRYALHKGSRVEWIPQDATTILVRRATAKPRKTNWSEWARSLQGLGKEVWEGIDPVEYTHRVWEHDRT